MLGPWMQADTVQGRSWLCHHLPNSFNTPLRTGWSISKKVFLPPAEHRANALGSAPNFYVREWVR